MSRPLVLDSSCWISWMDPADQRDVLVEAVASGQSLCVPSIVLYEVDRWIRRLGVGAQERMFLLARLRREQELVTDHLVALRAGTLAQRHGLAAADALIAASAQCADADLVTFDRDFSDVPGVIVLAA